jgi:hypothetical protein
MFRYRYSGRPDFEVVINIFSAGMVEFLVALVVRKQALLFFLFDIMGNGQLGSALIIGIAARAAAAARALREEQTNWGRGPNNE